VPQMVGKEAEMNRYHKLGFIVKGGKCFVAFYDMMSHTVQVLPAIEYKAVKDEMVPPHVVEEAVKDWEGKI
jgi:hypothetical protein